MNLKLLRQVIFMSKLALAGVCLQCIFFSMLIAADGKAQQKKLSEIYLSVNFDGTRISEAFREIESKTKMSFAYNHARINEDDALHIQHQYGSLENLLKAISAEAGLKFKRINTKIYVNKKDGPQQVIEEDITEEPEFFAVVSGTVTAADDNSPLPGVSIIVKGTTTGTTTDVNGKYSINVGEEATLQFSFIGYQTKEVAVGSQTEINVQLEADVAQLGEVVVVGYGTQKKVNVTGAVDMVSNEQIENRPATTATNALQGLLPGVTIQNPSGQPGSNSTSVRIRGIGSLNNSNPLILIDGFEGDINTINPQDIESISVLKDAASSAIYGSRGANGVVLITTKSGGADQPVQVSYNNYVGFQTPTRLPKFLGSPEYMELLQEAQRNVGQPITYTDEDIEVARNGTDPDYFANTDWIDAIYKKRALQQNHNISLQGGSDKINYYLSYGYLGQDGIVKGDAYDNKRNNVRIKLGTKVIDRLRLNLNLGYMEEDTKEPSLDTDLNTGLIYIAHRNSPLVPVRFSNGDWGYGGGASNPLAIAYDGGALLNNTQQLTGNFGATLDIVEGMTAKVQYGTVITNLRGDEFTKKITYYFPNSGEPWYADRRTNQLDISDMTTRYQSFIAQTDYNKSWGDHNFHILLGYSQEWEVSDTYGASRQSLVSDELTSLNIGTVNERNTASAYQWAIRSGFSRINYSFADRYLVEANIRYDGSSRFAEDERFGLFPSLSLGWRLSEEPFMSDIPDFFSDIKIRASWGKLGNQYLDADSYTNSSLYPYLPIYENVPTMPIGGQLTSAFAQTVLANPMLTWESATMTDIGLDLQLLDGKLNFSGDYFIKKTDDILLRVPLPDVIGMEEPSRNAGALQNKGWEIQLGWQDRVSDFNYGLNLNLSDVKNEVTSLGGVPPTYGDQIRQVGETIDAFYGLVADGLAQESDFEYNAESDTYTPLFPVIAGDASYIKPGDVKYKDLNNDGEITLEDDRQVIGNPFPRYTYALRGNLGWKGFDFSFFLQGVGKADGYIKGVGRHAFISGVAFPQEEHLDRWTPENTNASYPRFTYQQSHNQRFSSYWMENASYLRLKNIQLGYTLPKEVTRRARIEKLRIYLSADNLVTATDFFRSYDPESPVSEGGFYPQVKTFVAGINLTLQ